MSTDLIVTQKMFPESQERLFPQHWHFVESIIREGRNMTEQELENLARKYCISGGISHAWPDLYKYCTQCAEIQKLIVMLTDDGKQRIPFLHHNS